MVLSNLFAQSWPTLCALDVFPPADIMLDSVCLELKWIELLTDVLELNVFLNPSLRRRSILSRLLLILFRLLRANNSCRQK